MVFDKDTKTIQRCKTFQQIVVGQLDTQPQRNGVGPFPRTTYKNYLKMDLRAKTITLLEGSKDINLHDPGLGNSVLNTTTKGQATKEKTDKPDFLKITKEVKKQATENICKSYI